MSLTRRTMVIAITTAALLPVSGHAQTTVLRGTVNFHGHGKLPPDATVIVQLVDVSLADTPAKVIAEDRITNATTSPIPYRLAFDQTSIDLRHSYALQARIMDGDRLLFVNVAHHAIFAGGRNNTRIRVRRIEATPQQASVAGRWLAEDILGKAVVRGQQTVLEIAPDGVVTGSGGCNRFSGHAHIDGAEITFRALAATKMACAPAAMEQERKFHQALESARSFRIAPNDHRLILLDGAGRPVAKLAAM